MTSKYLVTIHSQVVNTEQIKTIIAAMRKISRYFSRKRSTNNFSENFLFHLIYNFESNLQISEASWLATYQAKWLK